MTKTAETQFEQMVSDYQSAERIYSNNQLGLLTDRAMIRMEKLVDKAERLGFVERFVEVLTK
jgi:hypothetical protein